MVWEKESKLSRRKFIDRTNHFFGFVSICFVIIILYLFYIQVIRGNYFYQLSEQNTAQLYVEQGPRGIIYDCNGIILSKSRHVSRVLLYPFRYSSDSKLLKDEINKVESLIPWIKIDASWYNSKNIVCLAENIPLEDTFRLLEQRNNLPSIYVVMEQRRYYPYNELASHVLGYVSEINPYELSKLKQEGYKLGDTIGKTGLEKQYDAYLKGKPGGLLVETDATGRQLNVIRKIEPEIGKSLHLTIDIKLQKIAEDELMKTDCSGAVVGLDPNNGAVKILASYPRFDPNVFVSRSNMGSEVESRTEYLRDENLPLYNRAVQGQYTPGSVFKIITSIAALDGKGIDPEKTFHCPGQFQLRRKVFRCWEEEGHKDMSFLEGIKNSCDVYFYNIGLETGVDLITTYAKKFHINDITKIDIPSENIGFIPTSSWRKKKIAWYDGDTVNLSIGQGYILVTPLRLATLISTVANKGTIWQPYLVEKIIDSKNDIVVYEAKPKKIDEVDVSENVWQLLEEGLVEVVSSGTGYGAHIKGINIAGKTGTAQNPLGEDHALFIAYAPVEKPEIALAIVVEHGGMGGRVAAPIARRILYAALKQKRKI